MKQIIDEQKLNTRKALALVADIQREQAQSNYPAPDSLRYERHELPASSTKRLSSGGSSGGQHEDRISSIGEVEFLPAIEDGHSMQGEPYLTNVHVDEASRTLRPKSALLYKMKRGQREDSSERVLIRPSTALRSYGK